MLEEMLLIDNVRKCKKSCSSIAWKENIIEDDMRKHLFFVLPHRRMFNQSEEQTENNKNDKGR